MTGKSIITYGASGTGKTTLDGEYAKWLYKRTKQRTLYNAADMGGYESIMPLVRAGVIVINEFSLSDNDPWIWINNAVEGKMGDDSPIPPDIGLVCFDSGTSMCESILNFVTKSGWQVGQQKTQKFAVTQGKQTLSIGLNNQAHYGLVQSFMLDAMWRSSWMTRKGMDVLWNFGEYKGEDANNNPIIGPLFAGQALTGKAAKWVNYCFRLTVTAASGDTQPIHTLHLQPIMESNGLTYSMSNARYPLDATTPLPTTLEPASLVKAFELIEEGQKEADANLAMELT